MSELHAAVAIESLNGLDERIAHRNTLVGTFTAITSGIPGLGFQEVGDGDVSTYKDLTLIVEPEGFGLSVPQLATALRAEGIDSRRYYWPPIHRQKAYADLGCNRPLPVTDRLATQVLTLPLWSHMTEQTVATLAQTVVELHEHAAAIRPAVSSDPLPEAAGRGTRLGGRP
jgi:dTDP-4-amino-4,6-dideoxygalactose transaminase